MPAPQHQTRQPDLADPRSRNFSVFRIINRLHTKTQYVGLCEGNTVLQEFIQRTTRDIRSPWHWQQQPFGSYDRPREHWPFYPELLETLKGFTRFEAAAAQQYWWEYYGGFQGQLVQCEQPLTRTEFILQRGRGRWDGYMKGFPNGWVPRL